MSVNNIDLEASMTDSFNGTVKASEDTVSYANLSTTVEMTRWQRYSRAKPFKSAIAEMRGESQPNVDIRMMIRSSIVSTTGALRS